MGSNPSAQQLHQSQSEPTLPGQDSTTATPNLNAGEIGGEIAIPQPSH